MKVIIVGGNGTIGRRVRDHLQANHEVIVAGRASGDVRVDIADSATISKMFGATGRVDAVVCIAGDAKWDRLTNLSEDDFYIGIRSKLMGQVNLVRLGLELLQENGSFTLTTGILADDPVDMTTSAAMVNGAIHSFVRAAALELGNGARINAVSAGLVEDAREKYEAYFPGHSPVSMDRVVQAYVKSILGKITGQVIRVY